MGCRGEHDWPLPPDSLPTCMSSAAASHTLSAEGRAFRFTRQVQAPPGPPRPQSLKLHHHEFSPRLSEMPLLLLLSFSSLQSIPQNLNGLSDLPSWLVLTSSLTEGTNHPLQAALWPSSSTSTLPWRVTRLLPCLPAGQGSMSWDKLSWPGQLRGHSLPSTPHSPALPSLHPSPLHSPLM